MTTSLSILNPLPTLILPPTDSGSSSTTDVTNIVTIVTTTTLLGGGQSTVTISVSLSAKTSFNTGSGNGGSNSGSSSSNLPSSLAGTTSGNSGASMSSPIGAIVGGGVSVDCCWLSSSFSSFTRRKKKKQVEQVQHFYDNPPSGSGPSSTSQYEASGVYRPKQTPEVGNRRGFFARKAATLAATSPQSSNANAIPNFPTAPLLQPNGMREEPLAESSQPVTSRRVVTHEDSGFRMPQAGRDRAALQSIIVEYPPAYTPG